MRSDMRAANQLPGRGPTDVDVAPVNHKSDDDDEDDDDDDIRKIFHCIFFQ